MSFMDQVFGYNSSITSSNSTSTSTVWTSYPNNTTHTGIVSPGIYTAGTGGLGNNITYNPVIDIKRCRTCNHAHLEEQTGCIDQYGWNTVFVDHCPCKEYLPKDNLEYLEYLAKKEETH